MEIQSFIDSPIFQETATKFRNKTHEETKQVFEDFIELQNEQPKVAASDVTEFVDNGVKSTLFLGRLDSHLNSASDAIDEADFKVNQGKRMNYYSTQKWDIGVYHDNSSTESNPSVLVSVDESESGGSRKIYRVHVNEVNMNDAACYEMFGAICYKTENWFDALSSFKWALDDNYGMDRVKPDGSRPADHVEQQLHPYDRLDFQETFRIAVEKLTANYDERLENVRATLLNMINNVDNGVKSTILISQLASHERSTATVTNISHTDGLPDGLQFTNAGGMTSKAHTTPTMTAQGLVYETVEDERHEYIAYYDTNSPEDSPVMYVVNQDKMSGKNEYLRIEVNKINPSNASYEEMIALVGYVFRDDPQNAFEASEALVHARDYMEMEGLSPDGNINYSQWLQEVVRRNINYSNPSNQVMGKAAQSLLEYLKDYPRGVDQA